MKKAEEVEVPEPKAQKTLFHYFNQQSQASVAAPVVKVRCPACDLDVPQTKINWHLDQDCKSKAKTKRKKDKDLVKRRKILKSVKNDLASRKRQKLMLSDDESDVYDSDNSNEVTIIQQMCASEDDEPFITSSMVETRIFEMEEEINGKTPVKGEGSSPLRTTEDDTSPYFSPNGKKTSASPLKRTEKIIDFDMPSSSSTSIAMLESDWTSPHSTPAKNGTVAERDAMSDSSASTPEIDFASREVREMLENDWISISPSSTPRKLSLNNSPSSTSRKLSLSNSPLSPSRKLSLSKKSPSLTSNSNSDDEMTDFESNTIEFYTPGKVGKGLSKDSLCFSKNKETNGKISERGASSDELSEKAKTDLSASPVGVNSKLDEDSEDDFETNPIQYKTPEKPRRKIFKSLSGSSQKVKVSEESFTRASSVPSSPKSSCNNSSEAFGTPLQSPHLVSPTRSPSPLPNIPSTVGENCSSLGKEDGCVRKLFSPTSPSKVSQERSVESCPSTSKIQLSPSIKNNLNRFSKLPENIGEGDPFDDLCKPSSQSQESVFCSQSQESSAFSSQSQNISSQSSQTNKRIWVRTPRKINQSIKCTSLLQSSPQNVNHSFIGRKRQHSTSPEKRDGSSQDASQNSPEKFVDGKYDKSMFRGHKGYYLENFLMIIQTVMSEPSDLQLFNDEDLSVVNSFHELSLQAQKLYVRLFQRKIKWNKVSKIDYKDICDQEDMGLYVNELSYAKFLLGETELCDQEEVLHLLSADELKGLCKDMKIKAVGRKEDLVNSLLKLTKQQRSVMSVFAKGSSSKDSIVLKKAKAAMGCCCIVNKEVSRVFMRLIMLYGLPKYDDEEDSGKYTQLTTLLMINMGKMNFPKYDVIRHHSIFQSREDLIRFEGSSQILTDVHECIEGQKWEQALKYCDLAKTTYEELINDRQLMDHDMSLPKFLRCYTSISVLVYILSCSVECYQRLKNYIEAVKQLEFLLSQTTHLQDYRGRWYDRLALNLDMHLKSKRAVEVIREALNDREVRKGHRLSLSVRAERMAASSRFKSLAPTILEMPLMKPREAPKIIIEGRCLPGDAGYKRVFIRQDSDRHAGEGQVTVCSVEELVIGYYKGQGYTQGLHREGTTVNSLFGLFFWDIIYSPVPDAFRSPHQAAPLDLDDSHFYESRKDLIEKRLSEIQNWTEDEAGKELERIWINHSGKTAVVAWDIFRNVEQMKVLVASLTLPVVASICRRLAEDHRFSRSGFPDLVVWDPINKKSCIVEVKGPNDRLSTKQILWLDYLLEHGAVAEVCHVVAIGAKKMKLNSPQRISPRKRSPQKSSPKKRSPKKSSPKKRSPQKSSPKKCSPQKRSPLKGSTDDNDKSPSQLDVKPKGKKGPTRKPSENPEEQEVVKRRSSRNQNAAVKEAEDKTRKKKKRNDDDDFADLPPRKLRQKR